MKQKTLFIFGAGASKADKAPLQNELFSEIFKLLEGVKYYQNIQLNQAFIQELKDFLYKLYPINEEPKNNIIYPTFEEVMGLIHFAIIRDESFMGFSYKNLRGYLDSLITLIAIILDKKLKKAPGINKKFIMHLYESFKRKQNSIDYNEVINGFINQNLFLNVNYDILLDSALYKLVEKFGKGVDYCEEIHNPYPQTKKIRLFKPHGSLNWLLCKSCGKIIFGGERKIAMSYYKPISTNSNPNNQCDFCKTILSPLIVPPSFFKELHNKIIRNVLINLENHLKEVENLVFIGYSFPEADLHLKYIFKKAQLLGGFKKIILINKKG